MELDGTAKNHEMCCPACGAGHSLGVSAQIWVDLFPTGSVESEQFDASHYWEDGSECMCGDCQWEGCVLDAKKAYQKRIAATDQ